MLDEAGFDKFNEKNHPPKPKNSLNGDPNAKRRKAISTSPETFRAYLESCGIAIKEVKSGKNGAKLLVPQCCPMNPDHGKKNDTVFTWRTSGIGFRCQHNSCAGINWKHVRAKIDPGHAGKHAHKYGNEVEDDETSNRKSSAASELVLMAAERIKLFHGPGGADAVAYARVSVNSHWETWPVKSNGFKYFLRRVWREETGKTINQQAVLEASEDIASEALFGGQELEPSVRIGTCNGKIYWDLCDEAWRAIEISQDGWKIVSQPPVQFIRRKGMLYLPEPVRGGHVDEYRSFINVPDDSMWALLLGWIVAALRPNHPFPILVANGEQGSAKTTLCKMNRALLDPNMAPVRRPPRDERDLAIAASNSWLVSYDNLSGLAPYLSDALCCIATGGGFSARQLYTDDGEAIFYSIRPCQINGIDALATRSDLIDRSLHLVLPVIDENRRTEERILWEEFEKTKPRIIGALCDAVVQALQNVSNLSISMLPRMADAAKWVTAAEPAFGWKPGRFIAALTADRAEADRAAVDASPIGQAIESLMMVWPVWEGTPTELMTELSSDRHSNLEMRKAKSWPIDVPRLGTTVRRLAPNLRRLGIQVLEIRKPKRRIIRLEKLGKTPSSPSLPSDQHSAGDYPGLNDGYVGDDGISPTSEAAYDPNND